MTKYDPVTATEKLCHVNKSCPPRFGYPFLYLVKGIYYHDLQSVVQLTQQWAAVNGKSRNLVVAQSHECVLAALLLY